MVEDSSLWLQTPNEHFFEVKLESFDGPIDLLLHLVKKNELPIEKLSLYQITNQYFECLQRMRHLDLEIAGEYLVIATTLLSIKSSILLNEPVEMIEDQDGKLIDPYHELLEKIRKAQIYKEGAMHLANQAYLGIDVFSNTVEFNLIKSPESKLQDHDSLLLAKAFRKVLSKLPNDTQKITISYDSVSIVERMMQVLDRLKQTPKNKLTFTDLILVNSNNRSLIVSNFLAILELAKRQAIEVIQSDIHDEIFIQLSLAENNSAINPKEFNSEFDQQNFDIQNLGEVVND